MRSALLLDADDHVAGWAYRSRGLAPLRFDRAVGVVRGNQLVGTAIFSGWNGADAQLSYYGEDTLTPGVVRSLARLALLWFGEDLARVTMLVPKSNRTLARQVSRNILGFKLEGAQRCYYGRRDCPENTALRFVVFREGIEKLARVAGCRAT